MAEDTDTVDTDKDAAADAATREDAVAESLEAKAAAVFKDADADDADEADADSGDGGQEGASAAEKPELSRRQREVAKTFHVDAEKLGEQAPAVLARLAQIESDIGKRWSELGRAEHTQKAGGKPGGKEEQADLPPLEMNLDDADPYDGKTLKPLLERINVLSEKLGQVTTRLQTTETSLTESAEASAIREWDAYFESVESDYPDLGTGPTDAMDENSDSYSLRCELMEEAAAIRNGHRYAGKDVSPKEARRRATIIVMEDSIRKQERDRIREAVGNRSRKRSPRPSHRDKAPDTRTPEEKALPEVRAAMKKAGVEPQG